jgi:hypothetical protein
MGWLKKLLNRGPSDETSATNSLEKNALYIGYSKLLTKRLGEFRDPVGVAFAKLFQTEPSIEYAILHIEFFLDEPGFSFRAFSMDAQNCQTRTPTEIEAFNAEIQALWPIITQDELDKFTVWEDDPKWGRQVDLEQPTDALNIPKQVLPWIKGIMTEVKGDFAKKITVNVHDLTFDEGL